MMLASPRLLRSSRGAGFDSRNDFSLECGKLPLFFSAKNCYITRLDSAAAGIWPVVTPDTNARIMKLTTKQKINRRWKIKRRAKRKLKRGL